MMNKIAILGFLLAASAFLLADSTTRVWEQKGFEDFDKGAVQKLSLSSEGKLLLAPRLRQLADPQLTYIWALAEDSRGNIYVGGGSPAKILRIPPAGSAKQEAKVETFFQGKELEVHALAVDADDTVFAATSPDPKIYKITRDGKSAVFFEPKAKYVWALALDKAGGLLVATGDKGEIYRVDRKGEGKLFYSTSETHARSMALDRSGNIIVGSDPGGLLFRVTPEGRGFVLYQAAKKEVTAVEVAPDGSIYAAAVGDKPPRLPTAGAVQPPPPAPVVAMPGAPPPAPPPVAGGSEVYRIYPDGAPRRIWASREEVVYTLALRPASGGLLAGSGNKGKITEIREDDSYLSLVKAQATQVTALLRRRSGTVLAATSNSGRLLEIGTAYEPEGWYESEAFDARIFARWGRVFWRAEAGPGAAVALYTRSGNMDSPDNNWSPWSAAYRAPGDHSTSPGGRFIQWKAVLTSADGDKTPWLDTVEIAYLPRNLPPVIDAVELTPGGYRFQPTGIVPPVAQPQMLTLPPLLQPRPAQPPQPPRIEPPANLQAQKGWQGVRWAAHDDNDDTLAYALYFRARDEKNWKLLKDKLADKFHAWDSTAFPDGVYYVKVVASDAPSNVETEALTDEREAGPFLVDNTPPAITARKAVNEGYRLRIVFHAADAASPIKRAEYSLDGADWKPMLTTTRLSDSLEEDYDFPIEAGSGEHTIAVRVYDRVDNMAIARVVVRN